jgi:hypothetical protein
MNRITFYIYFGLAVFAFFVPAFAGDELGGCKQPRVIVHEYSMGDAPGVLKWDCPVFAAYVDGTVIWRKGWRPSLVALASTDIQHAEKLVQKVESIVSSYAGKTFVLTESSEPEMTTVWAGGRSLTILGDWRKPRLLEAAMYDDGKRIALANEHERKLWATLPSEVRTILAMLRDFDAVDGRAWRPERLVLLLQPPSKVHTKSIQWPAQWPQSFTLVPGSQTMKWIELPGSMLDELLESIPDDGQPKAILLGGEDRYAELRLVFPGDDQAKGLNNRGQP